MKAIVFHEHGDPSVLRYTEVAEPKIGPAEVLVRVRACALNHLDLWVRRGLPGISIPLPHIPGSDISGEVARVGESVTRVKVGQRVLLAPGISCGQCPQCLAGEDNLCRRYTLFGYMVDGGCAEYVKSPEVNVIPIPGDLSFEEAAAVPLVFLTAWHMLITRAKLRPGEDLLVLGAGSGVGSAAVQIGKLIGARVLATAGSDAKLAKARELGADEVINHSRQKIADEVKRLTDRRGVDVVFEHVGTATWDASLMSLAPSGRLVTCGATTGYQAHVDIRYLFSRNLSILGSYMGSKAELYDVLHLVAQRKLRAVIDRTMPLEECALAHELMERREQFGKIVLLP
ncbi:MAG: zinc-binding dehydrogenase [Acidobacteriia bacterium]|jgi:NADPH:quinone reductase-like Zn-dependent oxidoreductase|nr:zinc-binding dehydrogenase [Terriglobia bacterium]